MVCTIDVSPTVAGIEHIEPTTAQLNELLQISDATRKRYVRVVSEAIGRVVRFRSHQRRYSNTQFRVLGLVRDWYGDGWQAADIVAKLRKINPEDIECQSNNSHNSLVQPKLTFLI
ncbi:MAG: hypothetical protein AAFO83_03395 [Cyanobacteria bacterium J06607_13]